MVSRGRISFGLGEMKQKDPKTCDFPRGAEWSQSQVYVYSLKVILALQMNKTSKDLCSTSCCMKIVPSALERLAGAAINLLFPR